MYRYITPEIVEGLHLPKPEYTQVVDEKIGLLTLGYIAVHDVDLTMTVNGFPDKEDLTSWGVMVPCYDEVDREVDGAMWKIFEKRQQAGTLTNEQAEFWWESSLRLITKDRTRPPAMSDEQYQEIMRTDPQRLTPITTDMVREAGEKMHPRPGVHEYTEALRRENVPSAWVTAGLADPCEAFARKHNIMPDVLLGTRFEFDRQGILVDWQPRTVIHPLIKNEQCQAEIRELRQPDEFDGHYTSPGTLLLGDSPTDPRMVRGDKVLRISVANPHGPNDEQYIRSRHEAGYDVVLKDEGLYVVESIVNLIGEIRRHDGWHDTPLAE